MSLFNPKRQSLTYLMILAVLVLVLVSMGGATALAQDARGQEVPGYVRWVRALEIGDVGISNPAGLAFSPGAKGFYVVEARGPGQSPPLFLEVIAVSPLEDRGATARIVAAIKDPINLTFDARANRLLIFQAASNRLIEVLEGPGGDLDPSTVVRHDVRHFDVHNPQGMAADPASGHLYILDAAGPRIVRIEPDPDGGFDGAVITEIDLGPADMADVRGLSLDPANGHFFVVSPAEQELYELTATGQVVSTRDLSGFGFVEPQGLVYAPSGDLTDDPAQMSLYIADSGQAGQQTLETGTAESSQDAAAGGGTQGSTGNITELSFTALPEAALADFTSTLVQTIDASAWEPPSPDPSGLAYVHVGDSKHLWIVDGEVEETVSGITHFEGANVWEVTLSGSVVSTANISSVPPVVVDITDEPTGVAWNPGTGHYFVVQDDGDAVFELAPGTDGQYFTADDVVTSFDLTGQNGDGEGLAFDTWNNRLFVADGVNREVYEYTLSGSLVRHFDVLQFGVEDPEGVEFNPATGTLYVMSSNSSSPVIVETTTSGDLLQTIDISDANARTAAGLAYAPASDVPGEQRFYIVDRAVDNNSDPDIIDGKMYEVTAPASSTEPMPPRANDDSASTVLATPVTINVVANDTDPNGDLDPTTTNITCGICAGPEPGSLRNNLDGTFTYTATAGFLGNDSFVYEVCDTEALCDTATATINVTGPVVDVRVSASSDDAEEDSSGGVGLGSSDLELVLETTIQTVGMRFNGVSIPQGATIINAYIQFQADEINTEATSLTIQGEDVDNAATFVASNGDISSRPRTTSAVSWSPPAWNSTGQAGPDQRTPDISPVIQEIVLRSDPPGWESGNSLVIIITGAGKRVAEAYDGVPGGAPLLHVEFVPATLSTSYDLALSPGWNLVSWPLAPLAENLTDTLTSCGACDEAWAYNAWNDANPWKHWPGELSNVDETLGLWLHATGAVTLPMTGWLPLSPTVELRAGWNLVGYPSQTAQPVAEALSSIAGKYTRVVTFDATDPADPWREYNVDLPAYANDLLLMEPGRGYWLNVTEDCTWIVGDGTSG